MLSFLQRYYREARRYREIGQVLLKHGLGYLGDYLPLWPRRSHQPPPSPSSSARRLRLALIELGPTFVKLGQFLSTRADLLPEEYIKELSLLQDTVPPLAAEEMVRVIEQEFGCPLDSLFSYFEPEPLGSASIAQVHRARLLSGEEVVVKVRRPGVLEVIETDLAILKRVARWAEKHTPWGKIYPFAEMVEEFGQALREECDFTVEALHAETFRRNLSRYEYTVIPRVFPEYTRPAVLTMEEVKGIKLSDLEALEKAGLDREELARRFAEVFLHQVLIDGFFHGDPHPGNLFALPGNRVAWIDFGIVGRLSSSLREQIGNLVLGLSRKSSQAIVRTVLQMGILQGEVNLTALRRDVEYLEQKYYEVPLSQVPLGEAFADMLRVAYRHRVRVPAELALLARALGNADGLVRQLAPNVSIATLASLVAKELAKERLSTRRLKRFLSSELPALLEAWMKLPEQLSLILNQLSRGEIKVRQENPDLRRFVDSLDRLLTRIFFLFMGFACLGFYFWLWGREARLWDLLPMHPLLLAASLLSFLLFFLLRL
ncbi:ABC1 kinase family protein [Ammonifex thiophilus]|uniref:AarF/ABC1/UbiB kinase family protein n=1 Tax=Ammonifex thiophilus TaxID=444093 RepID=A0A3D8P8B7_9THEO|nr:AarF/ABC1/UbiB kinase family protein [Ammonifex thiophilus]RDV84775.1 AarF/ABC1/UbiB kinase family protein [Ammonifex thiophilus]